MKDNVADRDYFDTPRATKTCPRCCGTGTIHEGRALAWTEPFKGAPRNALFAAVVGSSNIFEASKEAFQLAVKSGRPVAFEFNCQIVVVRKNDDSVKVARAWWQRAYNETPEQSAARR